MYAARRKVLDMLHDRVLTVRDAEELLDAMAASASPTEPSVARPELVGNSRWCRQFLRTLDSIAATESPALIQGERGTGKGLVAQMLHYQSPRAGGPFIAAACDALLQELAASELFGHEKGAFTGAHQRRLGRVELAREGTLFLDQIETLSQEVQAGLVRLIEEGTFERVGGAEALDADVRVVAATHVDLKQQVDEGRFRPELYYHLSVAVLQTAPLRDRREDIAALASHFVERKGRRDQAGPLTISPEAMETLAAHEWPGNVAELASVIEGAAVQCEGDEIEPAHLPELVEA